jgi:serine/threonine protein kinase
MALVYKANHIQMERTVVIKVMQGWLLSNKNSVERFERECKLTAKLNHPNIVSSTTLALLVAKSLTWSWNTSKRSAGRQNP